MRPEDFVARSAAWRKSSQSVHNGACVEVAPDGAVGAVQVRDSVDPAGPRVRYPARAWRAFLADAAAGRHGPPG
jgi:hypothetical protein